MSKEILSKLRTIRKEKGYTLSYLANITKLREATLSDIENGKQVPKIDTVTAIAEALDHKLSVILS